MKTIRKTIVVEAPPRMCSPLGRRPGRYSDFFDGITRWEPHSKKLGGVGARYEVLMQVGSIEVGGTIRVTKRTVNRAIEWAWEQGIHQPGRWILADADGGRS